MCYAMLCSFVTITGSFSFICFTDFAITLAGGIYWTTFLGGIVEPAFWALKFSFDLQARSWNAHKLWSFKEDF